MASDKSGSLTLESVLEAIQGCKEDLSKQIEAKTSSIQSTLTKIESSLTTLSDQVGALEEPVDGWGELYFCPSFSFYVFCLFLFCFKKKEKRY